MEDKVETATDDKVMIEQNSSSGHPSISGALKSAQSSTNNNERAKRASAVRFADQVNKLDDDMSQVQDSI